VVLPDWACFCRQWTPSDFPLAMHHISRTRCSRRPLLLADSTGACCFGPPFSFVPASETESFFQHLFFFFFSPPPGMAGLSRIARACRFVPVSPFPRGFRVQGPSFSVSFFFSPPAHDQKTHAGFVKIFIFPFSNSGQPNWSGRSCCPSPPFFLLLAAAEQGAMLKPVPVPVTVPTSPPPHLIEEAHKNGYLFFFFLGEVMGDRFYLRPLWGGGALPLFFPPPSDH